MKESLYIVGKIYSTIITAQLLHSATHKVEISTPMLIAVASNTNNLTE
jgi:hypothetical protein